MKLETITSEDLADDETELEKEPSGPPRPPPRYKKKVKLRGVENLNLERVNLDDEEGTHQNDILFNVCGSHQSLLKQKDLVEGNWDLGQTFNICNEQWLWWLVELLKGRKKVS